MAVLLHKLTPKNFLFLLFLQLSFEKIPNLGDMNYFVLGEKNRFLLKRAKTVKKCINSPNPLHESIFFEGG
jgi:hypothetical protein